MTINSRLTFKQEMSALYKHSYFTRAHNPEELKGAISNLVYNTTLYTEVQKAKGDASKLKVAVVDGALKFGEEYIVKGAVKTVAAAAGAAIGLDPSATGQAVSHAVMPDVRKAIANGRKERSGWFQGALDYVGEVTGINKLVEGSCYAVAEGTTRNLERQGAFNRPIYEIKLHVDGYLLQDNVKKSKSINPFKVGSSAFANMCYNIASLVVRMFAAIASWFSEVKTHEMHTAVKEAGKKYDPEMDFVTIQNSLEIADITMYRYESKAGEVLAPVIAAARSAHSATNKIFRG